VEDDHLDGVGGPVSYAPLDSDILYSTTIKEGPVVFAVWCAILASKDQYGVTALNPESLMALMSKPTEGRIADLAAIREAWDILAGPDPDSHNQDFEGRRIIPTADGRWLVVSHERYRLKHQKLRRLEQLRDAKARQRERERAAGVNEAPPVPPEDEGEGGPI
jgi:hypothetical protein